MKKRTKTAGPDTSPIGADREQSRREFVRFIVRGAGLVGLSGLCGLLIADAGEGRCVRLTVCGGCPAFSGCRLPKARTARATHPATTAKPSGT